MKNYKKTALFIILIVGALTHSVNAQTKHIVISDGVRIDDMTFEPPWITINVCDTVEWQLIGKDHNVNGKQSTYRDNPASFGNAKCSAPPCDPTYRYVFTKPGVYEYQCDEHVLSSREVGYVTVNSGTCKKTDIQDNFNVGHLSFNAYPNPSSRSITINLDKESLITKGPVSVKVFDMLGRLHTQLYDIRDAKTILNTESWASEIHTIRVESNDGLIETRRIIKQ